MSSGTPRTPYENCAFEPGLAATSNPLNPSLMCSRHVILPRSYRFYNNPNLFQSFSDTVSSPPFPDRMSNSWVPTRTGRVLALSQKPTSNGREIHSKIALHFRSYKQRRNNPNHRETRGQGSGGSDSLPCQLCLTFQTPVLKVLAITLIEPATVPNIARLFTDILSELAFILKQVNSEHETIRGGTAGGHSTGRECQCEMVLTPSIIGEVSLDETVYPVSVLISHGLLTPYSGRGQQLTCQNIF